MRYRHPFLICAMLIALSSSAIAHGPASPDSHDRDRQQVVSQLVDSPQVHTHPSVIDLSNDRMWVVNTRHLPRYLCQADIDSPALQVHSLPLCGQATADGYDHFLGSLVPGRRVVIHVHGNRMTHAEACERGRFVHRYLKSCLGNEPIDFVIFSWPSEQRGILAKDGREKAMISEASGMYLANLLHALTERDAAVSLVGFSFGCRVITGGLHALAGGTISGRSLSLPAVQGAGIGVALLAPALQSDWLGTGRAHGLATQNISHLAVLYNTRDAVLKRYWLVESDSSRYALGYRGPTLLAPGFQGEPVVLTKHDCARYLGLTHSETDYYTDGCRAGSRIAGLILQSQAHQPHIDQPHLLTGFLLPRSADQP